MKHKVTSVFATLLVALAPVGAADYAGTFKGPELTVIFNFAEGRYAGTLQLGDRKFPCTAREADGQLTGEFENEGHRFEFTARRRDGTLTLKSGGSTYTLQEQGTVTNLLTRATATNPLARPTVTNTEDHPSAPQPTATITNAGFLRFRRVSINDQANMIGGEAFSFLAPTDWQVEGGLVWRLHPTVPAAVAMRVRQPNGLEQLEVFPTVAFSWGGYLGPGTMFPPGANYLGNEVQPPVHDAIDYLKERHLPRVRRNIQVKIVKTEALPKLAEAARKAEPAPPLGGPQMTFTAGRVRIEYEWEGQAVEEDLYCVLNSIALPVGNMTIQIADKLYGLRAPNGRLDEATKLFETIIYSTRINLEWFNRYTQLVQALTRAQMNQIRAAGELSRYISRTSNEISDIMRQSYEERQHSQDRINKNWSQYMRGVDEYYNPTEQRAVELPSGYRNAWVNGNGEYLVTDHADFNPNVELGGHWQELKRNEP